MHRLATGNIRAAFVIRLVCIRIRVFAAVSLTRSFV
jgi:hypothetical protein